MYSVILTNFNKEISLLMTMGDQLINDPEILKLFFTEPVFLIENEQRSPGVIAVPSAGADELPKQPVIEMPSGSETLPPPSPVVAPATVNFVHVGTNLKNILVLVNDAKNPYTNEEGRAQLKKILSYLKIGSGDFAMVNLHNYPGTPFQDLQKFFNVRSALIFGIKPSELGVEGADKFLQSGESALFFGPSLGETDYAARKAFQEAIKRFTL